MDNKAQVDKFTEYATAFYGELPASQMQTLREPLMRLVMILISDLRAKFNGIDDDKLYRAVVAGLSRLNELGAKHPNIHRAENGMYVEAFQHACIRVRSIDAQHKAIQENRQREQEAAKMEANTSDGSKIAAKLYGMFSRYKEHFIAQGADEPAVEAYKHLLKNIDGFDLGGYAYYVIVMKIPTEQEIYYNDEVVSAVNAHPRLLNRTYHADIHPAATSPGSIGSFMGVSKV